ncbi:MAG: TonB-dependent receptor [Cytophagales bacterium]|nr:TonB-dependent receptor [Cytophagales bacterium]
MKIKYLHTITVALCFTASTLYSQSSDTTKAAAAESPTLEQMEEMSLEQLMNVPIVSASREKESSFDAPLTSYVVTRQEIEKAGSTSIPEALRLCPALLVSEITNGNYQVDIRGFNNVPAFEYSITNKFLLVMIDNRPVFNQLQGGTFWLSLPVDINDVERIEVVAGPSSALYGPNAVAGVINIITRRPDKEGLMAYTNSQLDAATMSPITNLSIGYKVNKFSVLVSGNYSSRKRFETDLYNTTSRRYYAFDEYPNNTGSAFNTSILFPDPKQAANRLGTNIYMDYKFNEKAKIDLSMGYNKSEALGPIAIGVGPSLGNWPGNSIYQRLKVEAYGFSFQTSNITGNQSFLKGIQPYQYDFRTTDVYIDYTYKLKDLLSIRPAISYQNALVDDTPYKVSTFPGIFNNSASMYNLAGSLKLEVTPIKMLRFVAGVRADQFKYPESSTFLSYEFIANIKPTDGLNFRFIYSRSYAGSYILPPHIDFANGTQIFSPNTNLLPAKMDMIEVGARVKASKSISVDIALFQQTISDVNQFLANPALVGTSFGINLQTNNLQMRAVQMGATLALNMIFLDGKIQFKPFVTVQKTDFKDFSPYLLKKYSIAIPGTNIVMTDGGLNSESYRNISATNTPPVYAGFFFNATPIEKLNCNLSGYYYDIYNLYGINEQPDSRNPNFDPNANFVDSPASHIHSKLLLNARVSYEVIKNGKVFVNARNLLNNKAREYYGSDQIGGMYTLGVLIDM